MRHGLMLSVVAALSLALAAGNASATSCKDPKTGKFIKCPATAPKTTKCRSADGKFAKCGTPGAKPAS